jgi:hypothetical protein
MSKPKSLFTGRWLVGSVDQWNVNYTEGEGPALIEFGADAAFLMKMRSEASSRIAWCPGSGVSGDTVEFQVREGGKLSRTRSSLSLSSNHTRQRRWCLWLLPIVWRATTASTI